MLGIFWIPRMIATIKDKPRTRPPKQVPSFNLSFATWFLCRHYLPIFIWYVDKILCVNKNLICNLKLSHLIRWQQEFVKSWHIYLIPYFTNNRLACQSLLALSKTSLLSNEKRIIFFVLKFLERWILRHNLSSLHSIDLRFK